MSQPVARYHGVDLHVEEVTGVDKSLDVVVDIFNRVTAVERSCPKATSH